MSGLEVIDNGIIYEGRKMTLLPKKRGKGHILNVDGRKIKVNDDELVLMYTFFSMMFKTYSKDMKKSGIYGN